VKTYSSKPCIHGCEILIWTSITALYSAQAMLEKIPGLFWRFCGIIMENLPVTPGGICFCTYALGLI
jgi:hypothetical protein